MSDLFIYISCIYNLQEWGKKVYNHEYVKEFIPVLLFINYCIIYLYYNYKPTFVHPSINCVFQQSKY